MLDAKQVITICDALRNGYTDLRLAYVAEWQSSSVECSNRATARWVIPEDGQVMELVPSPLGPSW